MNALLSVEEHANQYAAVFDAAEAMGNMGNEWYTILTCGGAYNPTPARGPWKTVEEAEQAVDNFRGRRGWKAGTLLATTNARIAGPFASRREALAADISDCTKIVECLR